MGNSGADVGISIDVDQEGNVYTTGYFNDTVDFDPNVGIYNLTAVGLFGDMFIQKVDKNGNLIWAKSIEAGSTSIFVDDSCNVYTTGNFSDTVDFDPNVGVYNLVGGNGDNDIFIQKLDSAGNFIWAKSMGGSGNDVGTSIVVDKLGNVYTTGYFELTVDFDPNAGIYNLPGGSVGDYAVMITNGSCIVTSNCINITGVIVEPFEKEIGIQVYPNPATTILYFSKDNDDEINIDIIDNLGRILISEKFKKRITEVSLEKLSPGIYYLFMNNKKQSVIQKIVKQ